MKSEVIDSILPVVMSSNTRPTRRIIIYSILIIWIVGINIWIYQYKRESSFKNTTASIYETFESQFSDDKDTTKEPETPTVPQASSLIDDITVQLFQKQFGIKDSRGLDAHSSIYDQIMQNHDINGLLYDLSFQERCDLYFTNLYNKDINWYLDPNHDFFIDMRHSFEYEKYRKDKTNELKEEMGKEKGVDGEKIEMNEEFEDRMKKKYGEFWKKIKNSETLMVDYVSHFRIFNKCYITADDQPQSVSSSKFISKQKSFVSNLLENSKDPTKKSFKPTMKESYIDTSSIESCSDMERRIYPWLSFAYPIYERWNGEISYSPPKMAKYISHSEPFRPSNEKAHNGKGKASKIKSKLTNNKACFLNKFKNSINGKGIVLSIGNNHVDDTVKLIYLLRALNNKFPIQIVYYDGISKRTKQRIVQAARDQFTALPDSFKKIQKYFPEDYLDEHDRGLPKQEVWFVNAHNVINDSYKKKFEKFANKFVAALFNSFEEYILLDADTVLVQNPEYFFNLKGYKKKGAYFYKDRTAPEFRPLSDGYFFRKLSPSIVDSMMFDIPIITKHTLELEFFDGMGHFMESGLVLIDRSVHFNSVLMMVQLNFFKPVTTRVYGDKEIFWLAFAINGDEGYQFNKYFAAAIGEETPMEHRLKSNGKPKFSKEICSAHPGHINGEDGKSLVWFNSGFRFCGQADVVDYKKEFEHQSRLKSLKSVEEMKTFFNNPLHLRHAIIPPFKNKLETLCENVVEEPKEGWHMDKGYCNSYLWCAYSLIGGTTSDGSDNTQLGQFIEFDAKATELFSYYGDIWVGNE